jgi:hypothetical protein
MGAFSAHVTGEVGTVYRIDLVYAILLDKTLDLASGKDTLPKSIDLTSVLYFLICSFGKNKSPISIK